MVYSHLCGSWIYEAFFTFQIPMCCGFYALEKVAVCTSYFFGRTGRHLFLMDKDNGKCPLLFHMAGDREDLKFLWVHFFWYQVCNSFLPAFREAHFTFNIMVHSTADLPCSRLGAVSPMLMCVMIVSCYCFSTYLFFCYNCSVLPNDSIYINLDTIYRRCWLGYIFHKTSQRFAEGNFEHYTWSFLCKPWTTFWLDFTYQLKSLSGDRKYPYIVNVETAKNSSPQLYVPSEAKAIGYKKTDFEGKHTIESYLFWSLN